MFFYAPFLLCASLFFSVHASNNEQQSLNATQATENINLMVATLLLPANHAGEYGVEIKKFTEESTKKLLDKNGSKPHWYSTSKVYKYADLYNGIVSEVVTFIENNARKYTEQDLETFFVPSFIKKSDLISRITDSARNEVMQIIAKNNELSQGALTNYVGAPLKARVHEMLKRELHYAQGNPRPKQYATKSCPICLTDFIATGIERRYLPCGHNICKNCDDAYIKSKPDKIDCLLCGHRTRLR